MASPASAADILAARHHGAQARASRGWRTRQLEVGLMLPCNVVVYEDDDRHVVVVAIAPTKTVAATGNPKLADLASTVKDKLTRAIERLE